jgi:glutathione S-transferase
MLTLYHFGGAIGAQKVRLALAEKDLNYQSHDDAALLRNPEYLKLNPNGVVPTLIHDGRVLRESRIISEYLEDAFPDPSLMPADPYGRYRARYWSKQIDDGLHLEVFTLSFVAYMREKFLAMPAQVRERNLPGLRDRTKRRRALELLEQGHESPYVPDALQRFKRLIEEMESTLASSGPWLAGEHYSLADADFTAYLHRLESLGLSTLWSGRPAVSDWFARVRARSSFAAAILDWVDPTEQREVSAGRARSQPLFERLMLLPLNGVV